MMVGGVVNDTYKTKKKRCGNEIVSFRGILHFTGVPDVGGLCLEKLYHVQENHRHRHRHPGGDHTYQAAKMLDFDSASCSSNVATPSSDDNSSSTVNVTSTTEDDGFVGPTTRRKWVEYTSSSSAHQRGPASTTPLSGSDSASENVVSGLCV
jgi:hypothetical protein